MGPDFIHKMGLWVGPFTLKEEDKEWVNQKKYNQEPEYAPECMYSFKKFHIAANVRSLRLKCL